MGRVYATTHRRLPAAVQAGSALDQLVEIAVLVGS
jgi:hypothetical protein